MLLMHGLLDSADGWIIHDDESPAFQLSRAGYDVWLGNSRGNKYSRKHVSLNTESKEFWNFSWEELGTYDLPAMTDYILSENEDYQKLGYIGHSMGTTQVFFALS